MSKTPRVMPTKPLRGIQTDSLHNLLSGMGGQGDKTVFAQFGLSMMDRAQQEAAYRTDWIARKIVDIPAQDAAREWRSWEADTTDITDLEELEKKFNLKRKVMATLQKARLYGGAAMILGVDQGKASDELKPDTLKKDCLKFVHVVSRYELTAGPVNFDVESPWYGEPQYYDRTIANTTGIAKPLLRLHPSRVVRLIGMEIPDLNTSQGWGDSVLQIVGDAVKRASSVAQGIAQLVEEAKVDVIHIPDLTAQINDPDYETKLKTRFGLASDAKSIYRMLLLDKEEDWERITQSFQTLPDIAQLYLLMACGAADIPVTRFMGESPKGLNATGVSDIRNYYDKVAAGQSMDLGPALERLDEVLIRSALGDRPDELHYTWNSLWQLDDTQKADTALKKAQTYKIDVDSGTIDLQVLQKARVNQLVEDATYPGLEQIVEDFQAQMDDLVDPANQPDPNAMVDPLTGLPVAPPAGGKPPAGKPPAVKAGGGPATGRLAKKGAAVTDMATRARRTDMRDAIINDAKPKTLYVRRQVLNFKDLVSHFKKQGFKTTVGDSMHVTIAWCKAPVDWMKAGEAWGQDEKGNLNIIPGGVRIVEKFGDATVLLFACRELEWRWCQIKENTGANWKYPDYQPHVTISWDGPDDISKVQPYTGKLTLGPEIFEEINPDWSELVVEDAKAAALWGDVSRVRVMPRQRQEVGDAAPAPSTSDKLVADLVKVMKDAPAPVINVTVPVTVARSGKQTTKVTKHDAKGRITEFERDSED